jgi:hypothetical protein
LNYKHCNNIVTISQIWNYKQSVTPPDNWSCNQTLALQQHFKQSVTILGPPRSSSSMGAGVDRHRRRGSRRSKGSIGAESTAQMEPTGLRVLWWQPSNGSKGGPPSSDVASKVVSAACIQPSRLSVPWRRPSHG